MTVKHIYLLGYATVGQFRVGYLIGETVGHGVVRHWSVRNGIVDQQGSGTVRRWGNDAMRL
jgi:hypothetical protein